MLDNHARESELDTEIVVEQKKRSIRETPIEAEAIVQGKKNELRQAEMEADVTLENKRKEFVVGKAENIRTLAEAEAHRLVAVMKAMVNSETRLFHSNSHRPSHHDYRRQR